MCEYFSFLWDMSVPKYRPICHSNDFVFLRHVWRIGTPSSTFLTSMFCGHSKLNGLSEMQKFIPFGSSDSYQGHILVKSSQNSQQSVHIPSRQVTLAKSLTLIFDRKILSFFYCFLFRKPTNYITFLPCVFYPPPPPPPPFFSL